MIEMGSYLIHFGTACDSQRPAKRLTADRRLKALQVGM
jgi:hypothetical protein